MEGKEDLAKAELVSATIAHGFEPKKGVIVKVGLRLCAFFSLLSSLFLLSPFSKKKKVNFFFFFFFFEKIRYVLIVMS